MSPGGTLGQSTVVVALSDWQNPPQRRAPALHFWLTQYKVRSSLPGGRLGIGIR